MELYDSIISLCASVAGAAPLLARAGSAQKNSALLAIAAALRDNTGEILAANKTDIDCADENGVPAPLLDRLMLNEARIGSICDSLTELAALTDPIGSGECWVRPSGIRISCVRAPLGVIGIIYEARPNVTVDAAALCIKTGNAVVLRGGKAAVNSNLALVSVMKRALSSVGLPSDAIGILSDTSHEGADILMSAVDYIDVLIPRGSRRLINAVAEKSRVPVIRTGAGNCHLYVDSSADLDMALKIAVNAKCQRPAVCNSIETLIVHSDIAAGFLPRVAEAMKPWEVRFRCDAQTKPLIPGASDASEDDWATEYDDYILAVCQVGSLDEAIAHINKYGTRHSEAIVTNSLTAANRFKSRIDAAAVYVNASTRFTDGGEFGFGAEIGISTQKMHARGPMGLLALTTQKYIIDGDGEVR